MTESAPIREVSGATPSTVEFRRIFDENAAYVWSTMRRLGVAERDRDDLTQELFMTMYALLPDYDRSRPIRPWLFGIAYRLVLRHRRKLGRTGPAREATEDVAVESRTAESELSSRQTQDLVRAAIESIEIHRRAVFLMKDIDGTAVPEIADALGIPLNTAYSRLRLARDDFRAAVLRLEAGSERR